MQFLKKNSIAQVWIETTIYIVIGLTIIAVIISVANPQIEKIKDKMLIEQVITSMNNFDNKILEVSENVGSIGKVNLKVSKGKFQLDCLDDRIVYLIENTNLKYSEPETEFKQGSIFIITEKMASKYRIRLFLNYNFNMTCNGEEKIEELHAGGVSYPVLIENKGGEISAPIQMDFRIA